tara:strand:- start:18780 stop:21680 length:2901 start_codon:yes stop_codon:yes gene_type:complete
MAYKFKPYISQYVDPQSVKINEVLRKRYVDNFAAENMLDKNLQDMLVEAEFEGDVAKANELRQRITEQANERSKRGDYENLGMNIQRDVRDFYRDYKPLEKNYVAREADKKVKQDMLARGLITPDDYDNWLQRSLYQQQEDGSYVKNTGVQYDEETGLAMEGSIYQPVSIAQTVDYSDEIRKGLQGLPVMKNQSKRVQYVRQAKDANGNPLFDENGIPMIMAYDMQGQLIEEITPDQIRNVVQSVFRDPKTSAYLDQQGEFATFNMGEQDLNNKLYERLQTLESKLPTVGAGDQQKIREEISDIKSALEGGDINQMRRQAKLAHQNGIYEQYLQDTIDSRAFRNATKGISSVTPDTEYYIRLRQELANQAKSVTVADPMVSRLPGSTSTVVNPFDNPSNGVGNGDGVLTREEVEAGQKQAEEAAVVSVTTLMESHSSLLDAMNTDEEGKLMFTDDIEPDDVAGQLASYSYTEMAQLANKMAVQENADANVIFKDLMTTRNAVLQSQEVANAAQNMQTRINSDAGFTPTQVTDVARNSEGVPMLTPDVYNEIGTAEGVAPSIVASVVRNLAVQSGSTPSMMMNINGSAVDLSEALMPLLTGDTAQGGFGLDPQEAHEIIKNAVLLNQQLAQNLGDGYISGNTGERTLDPNATEFDKVIPTRVDFNAAIDEAGGVPGGAMFIADERGGPSAIQQRMPTLSMANANMINDFVQNFSNAFIAEHKSAGKRADQGYRDNSTQEISFNIDSRPVEDFDSNISEFLNKQFRGQTLAILEGLPDRNGDVLQVNEDGKVKLGDKAIADDIEKAKISKVEFTKDLDASGNVVSYLVLTTGTEQLMFDQRMIAQNVKDTDKGMMTQTLESSILGTDMLTGLYNRFYKRIAHDAMGTTHTVRAPELSLQGGNWEIQFTPSFKTTDDSKILTGIESVTILKDGTPVEIPGLPVKMSQAQFSEYIRGTEQRIINMMAGRS